MQQKLSTNSALIQHGNRVSRVILFCLLLLLVLAFSVHKIESRDFGWLLKTGQYIYEEHQVPRVEIFSYTAAGNKYIDSHWLFQLILFVSYRFAGIVGPTLLMAGILLITFTAIYLNGFDKSKYVVSCILPVAAAVAASERFLARPHLVTFLFIAIYFLILERHKRTGSRAIFLLPLFQLLWVNMHGLFIMGLILPSTYLFFGFIESKVKLWRRQTEKQAHANRSHIWLTVVLTIMVCESFMNPYTIDVAFYPFTLFREVQGTANVVATGVSELVPPLSGSDLSRAENYFKWMVYLFPLTFLLNIRRFNLIHASLFAAFLYLGLIARRNIALFAIIATPIAIMNINGFMDELSARFNQIDFQRLFGIAQLIISPLLMLGIMYMVSHIVTDKYFIDDRSLTRFGFGVSKHAPPIRAANFIESINPGGQMFNDPADGGYMIWRFYPGRKVYFDGRWEVYGNEYFENFKRVCSSPALFEEHATAMDIRYALLPHSIGHQQRLIKHMLESPGWELVYLDAVSVVFIRNTPDNSDSIEKFAIDLALFEKDKKKFEAAWPGDIEDPRFSGIDSFLVRLTERIPKLDFPFEEIATANFYFKFDYYDNARLLYEKSVRIYPDSEIAHSRLGTIYWKQGLIAFAMEELEEVDRLNPHNSSNLMNLGNLNMVVGRLEKAEYYFKRVRKANPENATAPLQLGKIYFGKGLREMAAKELGRALELDPDLEEARRLLQKIESTGNKPSN